MIKYKDLVEILGCSVKTAYNKLYNIETFTLYDLTLLANHYNLSYDGVINKVTSSSQILKKRKEEKQDERIKKNN